MIAITKILLLTCLVFVGTRSSYADSVSMYLNSVGGATNSTNTYYIYPYYFNINGSSTLTPLMCVLFDNEVTLGETWSATLTPITKASTFLAQEDAYLFSLLGHSAYSADDIQEAVWFLSTNNKNAVTMTTNDVALLANANAAVNAADAGGYAGFDNGQYSLYIANAGSQPSGAGTPQNYIGLSPVPEPGSVVLLGSGMLGCVAVLYRRRRQRLL